MNGFESIAKLEEDVKNASRTKFVKYLKSLAENENRGSNLKIE